MQAHKNCLMIDDDIDDQDIFLLALRELDIPVNCTFAFDGEEAIKILEKDSNLKPDIIFLDINMPKMNGKECLAAIKQSVKSKNIPVVIYSTSSEKKMETELRSMGAAAYFTKPSSISELTKKLAELIETV